jgi:hypothetical protein
LIVKAEVRTVPGQKAELEEHEITTFMVPGLKIYEKFPVEMLVEEGISRHCLDGS